MDGGLPPRLVVTRTIQPSAMLCRPCAKSGTRLRQSQPSRKKQDDDNDQEDGRKTDAAVTEAVTEDAEATAEATGKEDDEYDNKMMPRGDMRTALWLLPAP